MTDLIAETALGYLKPVQIGPWILTEPAPEPIHAILPYPGQLAPASEAMEAATGLALPAPGRSAQSPDLQLLWAGREHVFALGALPDGAVPETLAATVEISDGWARLRLSGPGIEDVLARGTPLDLRAQVFPPHATARTEWHHMAVLLTRLPSAIEIWVMRSYAETAVAHLRKDMTQLAARHQLTPR
ncbi:sarcosine oxidase subunit gamma [Dinoroseobacter sp. S76]|uniref:sarcosine oxidase subunit gamma n=1 Tax=Dinoroseobacter sp. S76 TaxID=3415124 RepID=UPI003C7AF4C5